MECPFEKVFPSQLCRDDLFFMKLAYNQAIDAWNEDEVPVGAVIEYNQEIVASAHNMVESTNDPTAHAEILAITQAANAMGDWRLTGCTLYVTKEPCPMCSGAAIMARFEKIVYALPDLKMGCIGGATNINDIESLNHHFEITSGVYDKECHALLQAFFQQKRLKKDDQPFKR